VPPYARSGVYKELAAVRELLVEFRSEMSASTSASSNSELIPLIAEATSKAGLYEDLPYSGPIGLNAVKNMQSKLADSGITLNAEIVDELLQKGNAGDTAEPFIKEFVVYAEQLWSYVLELENRLFSEGLHVLGSKTTGNQVLGYMEAVLEGSGISHKAMHIIAEGTVDGRATSEVLLAAQRAQRESKEASGHAVASTSPSLSMSPPGEDWNYDDAGFERSGVRWEDLFTDEDKFGFSILSNPGGGSIGARIKDYAYYQWLRWRREWNYQPAIDKLNDLLAIGLDNQPMSGVGVENKNKGSVIQEALQLAQALAKNSEIELRDIVRGIGGEFILPAPGGDIIRDGIGVLPTGRNIHALDPYRIPSNVALARGKEAAQKILDNHLKMSGGSYPETVAVTLWGLDTIKTKGESIGILLGLIGAEPVREATGRIVAFRLIPLSELNRPRIDILTSLSGIFRDSFGNVLGLLDDLFEQAALAPDEPASLNFIKKHTESMIAQGIDRPTSRLFSNPPGDFGSMVNEQIGSGEWNKQEELGNTWENRNGYSYGKDNEKGVARPQLLKALLNTTDRIVQEIDCVEYGLTDIQEYYANTGALKTAAENNRGGLRVNVSIVEAFEKNIRPRELEDTLRMEYRTKFLNPKWSEAMLKQGSSGAYEISGRMTALIGWTGTLYSMKCMR
jgi:cobalamin biosynthesis Mg chelatase CobN